MAASKANLFIVGLDDFTLEMLKRLPQAAECEFHPALTFDEIRGVAELDIPALLNKATERMESFDGRVDGVASYLDFPGTALAPVLAERFHLPGPSVESVFKCESKYWSRLEQQKVIPDHIPQFRAFDPFDDNAFSKLGLLCPFWIKPIKSYRSFLAFQINDERQFKEVMTTCREKVGFIGEGFQYLMEQFDFPDELVRMPETFMAETPIGGAQCTLEGYVYNGQVRIYGVVDSVREQDSSSFSRYEYPSMLPLEVTHQMMDVARLAVTQIGLDNAAFNVEFFYSQTSGQLWLLEINPRLSQSHADLFQKVHGSAHLSVMVDLALGRHPKPMERQGEFSVAAKFMLRTFSSGRVQRVPDAEAVARLQQRQPGTVVSVLVEPGQHLEELETQDMYSYELANVFIGGRDRSDLLDKYDQALTALQFDIAKDAETRVV